MRFSKYYILILSIKFISPIFASQTQELFIQNLISQMTLEEKIGQMNLIPMGIVTGPNIHERKTQENQIKKGLVGGIFNIYSQKELKQLQDLAIQKSRLKIPLIFGFDVIHGHHTIFPMPLALASSWNLNLIEEMARISAVEMTADGLHWTFSPMVDVARDPRWGRVMESSGEDPYLGSLIAAAMVKGYQGNKLSDNQSVLSCVKHFALYGAIEAGRDYNTVDMSFTRMYNEYFPPYQAAIEAGAGSVMSSFNEINGVPASGSSWLMQHVLRDQFHFQGFVVTDYSAIYEMQDHGYGNALEVTKQAFLAPIEMDMADEMYLNYLPNLVETKQISIKQIDEAVYRILEAKWNLGLFQNPYKNLMEGNPFAHDAQYPTQLSTKHLNAARHAAAESMVLLKNSKNLLPLSSKQKIAFIGPFVKDKNQQLGEWRGAERKEDSVSLWDALNFEFKNHSFLYAQGANFTDDPALSHYLNQYGGEIKILDSNQLLKDALKIASQSDIIVAVLGEPFGMSGEAASRAHINLLKNQKNLLKKLKKLNKPIVLVLMNGRPLTLSWEDENLDAILEAWYGGTQAGSALVDVLFGKYNPSGKLTMTFPRHGGQIPIYYNAKNTGRPYKTLQEQFNKENERYKSKYLDVLNTPLYPFGYGLSYTNFEYGKIQLNKKILKKNGSITATIQVKNIGKYDGEEVVQLYLQDRAASLTRPVKELKAFQKIKLKKGKSTLVSFQITEEMLKFYNTKLEYKSEPGQFKIFIGGSSDTKIQDFFNLED